ncbi:hypothetical protein CBOM_00836 [Ceraceosorus bombacis]|uniref:Uncharacterized protein n=1 Tax=Ceraceosorus bombacis TaxID=401625 RepID=A0A0P1BBR0_9BASI|nr:hypothetical protein CBOM_00836 [Ceraceosorus bombacis]
MYTHGPGIALAQLAPPNHKYKVPRLPLIPNASKRELAWGIFWMILVTGVCALLLELRAARRRMRKGKGVSQR